MDVVTLGELLIDFTNNGVSGQGNGMYEANPGGAPCNVLAFLQKLGHSTAFIGKVGKDSFGTLLAEVLREQGICTEGLLFDEVTPTTLAFVHTRPDGDREFSFYRNPGADMMLRKEEVDEGLIQSAKIFHFGSLSMTSKQAEEATKYAVETAKKSGALISFDPNLRPPLWSSLKTAKEKIQYGLSVCDILKISDNEVEFMTGEQDIEKGVLKLTEQYPVPLVCATMGKDGSMIFHSGNKITADPFHSEATIETTGAGDTFCGAVLHFILQYGMDGLSPEILRQMASFANAAACLITTRKGALRVMPSMSEIEAFRKEVSDA